MLEKIIYKNHINESLEFGNFPLFVNANDLHDFAWEITSKNDKISTFQKGIVSKTMPIIIACNSEAEGVAFRNKLFEVFEKDVLAKQHGKIYIGDYYLKCFITGSKKAEYLVNKKYMYVELTVQTDYPEWVKETTTVYSQFAEGTSEYLDFPVGYSFDYANELLNGLIENTNFVASNFRLTIYGQISKPTLYIGGHGYSVDVDVAAGEYLTIDSVAKTIVLTKVNGEQVNCFNKRDRDSYIFEKIPAGTNAFSSPNESIYFDITLLDERSEPKWI